MTEISSGHLTGAAAQCDLGCKEEAPDDYNVPRETPIVRIVPLKAYL
jgi:hypothetical protein